MAGKSLWLRFKHRNAPEFCIGHNCPYSEQHRWCHRTPPNMWLPFPAHPGIHAGMVDIHGRRWTHHPYEGWELSPDSDKFVLPLKPKKHRWYCFVSSVLKGRCSH